MIDTANPSKSQDSIQQRRKRLQNSPHLVAMLTIVSSFAVLAMLASAAPARPAAPPPPPPSTNNVRFMPVGCDLILLGDMAHAGFRSEQVSTPQECAVSIGSQV